MTSKLPCLKNTGLNWEINRFCQRRISASDVKKSTGDVLLLPNFPPPPFLLFWGGGVCAILPPPWLDTGAAGYSEPLPALQLLRGFRRRWRKSQYWLQSLTPVSLALQHFSITGICQPGYFGAKGQIGEERRIHLLELPNEPVKVAILSCVLDEQQDKCLKPNFETPTYLCPATLGGQLMVVTTFTLMANACTKDQRWQDTINAEMKMTQLDSVQSHEMCLLI